MATSQPTGLPFIVANEAAERFSYYGMKAILVVFMTTLLMGQNGHLDPMSETEASLWYHIFSMGNYLFPIIGGILADVYWGKYKTIVLLSVVYCLGHAALAADSTRLGLAIGLSLIALGAGGIKPCVSAHLGDQYNVEDEATIERGFGLFYLAINIGAFLAILFIPIILDRYGPEAAFAVPGIMMAAATVVFTLGRNTFRTIAPVGLLEYKNRLFAPSSRQSLIKLAVFFIILSIFWSLFDQTGSSWVVQANKMDTSVFIPGWGQTQILPAQIQAANPLLVLILVPLTTYIIYPKLGRHCSISPLSKMTAGMFFAAAAFMLVAYTQSLIDAGQRPSIMWQGAAYILLTIGEVLVSITSLEFAYTRAPRSLKSLVMGMYFLSVALGNGVTAAVNGFLVSSSTATFNVGYFFFFASISLIGGAIMHLFFRYFPIALTLEQH